MRKRANIVLERDDPDAEPLVGHIKVTRKDWLNVARDVLIEEGVAQVKVLPMAARMNVSRSSFYWYFKNRKHLLQELLVEWEQRNTQCIVTQCRVPTSSINEGACNFFRCFIDPALFDRGLDFAVREWARRDSSVRERIEAADAERLKAITALFARHGFEAYEADCRARILYFMQLGYHALDVRETMQIRTGRVAGYLKGFTGQEADADLLSDFVRFAMRFED